MKPIRVFITLTYYRPHYSGLTIYVERLARALAQRGHWVTILTSRYDWHLPKFAVIDGVQIWRLNTWLRISKGVIMPAMPFRAWQLARQADIVNLHVPQLDAALVSVLARLLKKPVVLTYHCDLKLPKGAIHALANQASHLANHIAARMANVIVTNTRDYAEHSSFLGQYLSKVHIIPPPIEVAAVTPEMVTDFKHKAGIQPGQRLIGMAARLAAEKGVEFLVAAMPEILERHPQARVLFVGQYQDVLGEEAYIRRLRPMIDRLGEHWTFLGVLPPGEFAAFLKVAEVTVLPSINSTESYGMVQVESMTSGTPVVATDLPGVRQPIQTSGMGRIVPVGDSSSLAKAISEILENPHRYPNNAELVAERHSSETVSAEYETLFRELLNKASRSEKVSTNNV